LAYFFRDSLALNSSIDRLIRLICWSLSAALLGEYYCPAPRFCSTGSWFFITPSNCSSADEPFQWLYKIVFFCPARHTGARCPFSLSWKQSPTPGLGRNFFPPRRAASFSLCRHSMLNWSGSDRSVWFCTEFELVVARLHDRIFSVRYFTQVSRCRICKIESRRCRISAKKLKQCRILLRRKMIRTCLIVSCTLNNNRHWQADTEITKF
jgi:hypothetical protein